jgi:hypothetical protein
MQEPARADPERGVGALPHLRRDVAVAVIKSTRRTVGPERTSAGGAYPVNVAT